MAFYSELTLNVTSRKLVTSPQQPTPLAEIPSWFVGEVREIKVCFVRDQSSGAGKVSIVSAVGASLRLFLGDPGEDPPTMASAAAAVNNVFTVVLPLNLAAVEAFLGELPRRQTWLEFELTSTVGLVKYQVPVYLLPPIGVLGLADPAPPETGLGVIAANALYVPQLGVPGGSFILKSEDNLVWLRIYARNDGELGVDNVTPP